MDVRLDVKYIREGNRMKKTKILKMISVVSTMLVVLTACGVNSSKPEYLLEGARDNGFIAAYRAYYAINDDTVKKISKRKYEKYVYREKAYEHQGTTYYSINTTATSKDISAWEFEQNQYDDKTYDKQTLIDQLGAMGIEYEGKMYILVTVFDDYEIYEVKSLGENDMILDSKYAVFHNGNMLTMEGDPDLSSIRSIYRYKG